MLDIRSCDGLYSCVMPLNTLIARNSFIVMLSHPNILIETNGDLRLGDFGIVRDCSSESDATDRRQDHTFRFGAPEVVSYIESATVRSDVYSCGVVMQYLLLGKMSPARPAELLEELSERWKPVLQRALHIDPLQRFESTAEFRDTIQNVVSRHETGFVSTTESVGQQGSQDDALYRQSKLKEATREAVDSIELNLKLIRRLEFGLLIGIVAAGWIGTLIVGLWGWLVSVALMVFFMPRVVRHFVQTLDRVRMDAYADVNKSLHGTGWPEQPCPIVDACIREMPEDAACRGYEKRQPGNLK